MAPGAAWNLVDYIPQHGGPLRKRGGWAYASPDIAGVSGGENATYIQAVVHAPFAAAAKLCAIDEDGLLYTVASSSSATHIGTAVTPLQVPVFHRDRIIITASNGTTAPKSYTGSTLADLAGSPPAAKYAGVYKDRTLLGNTSAQPQRLSFSDAGDPTTWNAAGYIDTGDPIKGLATLRNAVLVYHDGRTERIRGATPPPNTDMVLEPLFDQGCIDARSIALYGEFVIFANTTGVFLTDAATILDLTEAGGLSKYWQTLMSSYAASTWTLSAGVFRGNYVISVMNGTTFKDCLVCDLDRRVWFRLSNVKGLTFAPAYGTAAELYFGVRGAARVGSFSSVFAPAATYKSDAESTAVAPVVETQFTPLEGQLRIKHVYVGHDIRDAATDNPILTVSYVTSPEATAYTDLGTTLAETSAYKRSRIPVNLAVGGIGFKVTQTNASSDTYLYGLELEGHSQEKSRRAQ